MLVARFCHTAREIESCGELAIDRYFSGHEIRCRYNLIERNIDLYRFSWPNHTFELGSVDSGCDRHRAIVWSKLAEQDCTTLQTAFAQNDSRYKRETGEVPLKEKVVD